MRLLRVAIANINTTVGALEKNILACIDAARLAASEGADLVSFPEQVVGGYGAEDLVQWPGFVEAQWQALQKFAEATSPTCATFVLGLVVQKDAQLFNCAAVVCGGHILGLVPKEKLPTYNIFYEGRTLSRGRAGALDCVRGIPFGDIIFEAHFGVLGVEVCEDAWSPEGPMKRRAYAGAEIIINVSASPFRVGIENTRKEMLATRSADYQVTTVYCNLLGGNDGLVFDGGGYVVQNGRTVFVAPRFHQGVTSTVIDLDKTSRGRMESTTWREDQRDYLVNCPDKPHRIKIPSVSKTSERPRYPVPAHANFFLPAEGHVVDVRTRFCEEILSALVLGLGDYFEKVGSFQKIGVALSGGRDSALCLIIAREYVDRRYSGYSKRERDEISRNMIRAFFMPSRHTSAKTTAAARQLAADLGVPLVEHSIEDAFTIEETAARALLSSGESLSRLARQNIQARLRAQRMWTWSNSSAGLFLQTSNMSEKAVGYTTIGGDLEGALSVIANLPKTVVNYILEFLKERTGSRGIALTLEAPASAELDDDQEDERDLMPFPVLDACISLYAGERLAGSEVAECLSLLFPQYTSVQCKDWASRFIRLFTNSVYKWAQSPPAIHIGNIDLDRERALQLPIVQKLEW